MKLDGRFGEFGGTYAPQILVPALEQLEKAFIEARDDPEFQSELSDLLADFLGRPTPLYRCQNLVDGSGTRVYLKREDLVHGGAHKTNQVLAQLLLAKRTGKTRLIAETGAGQHGVATAIGGALFDIDTEIYMGKKDIERQRPNVERMKLLGAQVHPVKTGRQTLKAAINEAMRDWAATYESTHYLLGTVAGPHPYPLMVREFQRVIGREARRQILEKTGQLPDVAVACVGGGSNAIGLFSDFVEDSDVELIGVEPGGAEDDPQHHGETIAEGRDGILHGARTRIMGDGSGQIGESESVAAGLDYPGVGPEHAHLAASGRATYTSVTDEEALKACRRLSRQEGIIPALESAHAVAYAIDLAESADGPDSVLVNLSGRGDKDLEQISNTGLRT